jgi:hypothetical protein
MLVGGDLDDKSSEEAEDNKVRDDERGGGADGMRHNENVAEDRIKIDKQEEAMLDLLQLCQDAGTSLQFFDKLVAILRWHGKKGFHIRRASKWQNFLDKLRKKMSCPRRTIIQVGPCQVPKFDLLEQIIDSLKSVVFDDVRNLCVNLNPEERFLMCQATAADCFLEVHGSKWHRTRDQELVNNHNLKFRLPLMFYIDEMGTNTFQRHPL